jgi:hypothetical protein
MLLEKEKLTSSPWSTVKKSEALFITFYVPNLRVKLFSFGTATESGVEINFKVTRFFSAKMTSP